MSKRGEELLIGIGKLPKGKPSSSMHDEPDADDEGGPPDDDADDEVPMGAVVEAEELCRKMGWDEDKAEDLARCMLKLNSYAK